MSKYLQAARDLLIRHGKPMHYSTLTFIAIKIGLLKTSCQNPDIVMCSALSKDVSENQMSVFKKRREGVYDIVFGERLGVEILNYNKLGHRLSTLANELELKNETSVLRRTISIINQLLSCSGNKGILKVSSGEDIIRINIFSTDANQVMIRSKFIRNCSNSKVYLKRVPMVKEICTAFNCIREKIGLLKLDETLDYCVLLLEFLYEFQKEGIVEVIGEKKSKRILIINSRE